MNMINIPKLKEYLDHIEDLLTDNDLNYKLDIAIIHRATYDDWEDTRDDCITDLNNARDLLNDKNNENTGQTEEL
uniref:Uncharacterized protein n=1 Tax=viral metagenome TaxID=1070528 RepID=A0A6M3L4I5_9ZZZZ